MRAMSSAAPRASVVVRTLNSSETLGACLASLTSQTIRPEIVIVDSGSTDATLEIAARLADRVVELPPGSFTYGRALNVGAAAAMAPVHFAVSSHCVIPRPDWIERSLRHYERSDVAGTNGQPTRSDGSPLTETLVFTTDTPLANPLWGFSNHASSWRAEVWHREPFDESLIACEDFEWSDRVIARGYVIVFDPALTVPGHHLKAQGPLSLYRRSHREVLGAAACRNVNPMSAREAVAEWWSQHPSGTKRHRQRLSPYRVARIAGRYTAGRAMRRHTRRGEPIGRLRTATGDGRSAAGGRP